MNPKVVWIGIIVTLLGGSVIVYGVAAVIAVSDPSFAVEPDYEQKAANWDERQRERAASAKLGWTVDLSTTPGKNRGESVVRISVFDQWGKPIMDGDVSIEAFHNARAGKVFNSTLTHVADGMYTAALPLRKRGEWEFRVAISRGDDRFLDTIRTSVTPASATGR